MLHTNQKSLHMGSVLNEHKPCFTLEFDSLFVFLSFLGPLLGLISLGLLHCSRGRTSSWVIELQLGNLGRSRSIDGVLGCLSWCSHER